MRSRYYFKNLRECLDHSRIFITVGLEDVDEGDLRLSSVAIGFDNWGIFLHQGKRFRESETLTPTVTSRNASASIWSGLALQSTDAMRPCQMH